MTDVVGDRAQCVEGSHTGRPAAFCCLAPRTARTVAFLDYCTGDLLETSTTARKDSATARGGELPDQWAAVTEIGWAVRSIKVRLPKGLASVT
jgi:hypothetical protein